VKKALILTLALVIVCLTAGCQKSRTAISADTFTAKAEEAGYTVQNVAEQFSEGDVNDYLCAIKGIEPVIDYQIEFAVLHTVDQAKQAYQVNVAVFDSKKGASSSYSTVTLGNYSCYYLTTNGRYYVISRTDNTFIYVDADAKYKKEIDAFLKKIGY